MNEVQLSEYQIESGEYFINVEDIKETPEEIKAYIPKLMPQVELGEAPRTSVIPINPSILINDPKCKVHGIKPVLIGQNFITLKPYGNERPNFRSKAKLIDNEYIVPKHNKFVLEVQHHDIDSMYFTGKE